MHKKVLINVPDLDRQGGIAVYYKNIKLNELKNIDYFIYNSNKTFTVWQKIKFLIPRYFVFITRIYNYNVINLNTSFSPKAYYRDMVFLIISKIFFRNVIVFWHGWNIDLEKSIKSNRFLLILFKITFGNADSFIVLGEIFKKKLIDLGISPQKPIYVETIFPDDKFLKCKKRLEAKPQNTIQILFLSRILKEKGIYIAIDSFELIRKKAEKNLILVIAGDGPELYNAIKYVEENNIENVIFKGYVSELEKHHVYTESDIFLFPTYYGEGLPIVVLEALLYGLPIITRNNAAISEVIENEVNGLLTESVNPGDFANLMNIIISNPTLMKEMSERNKEKALKNYTTKIVKNRMLKIYCSYVKNLI